MTKDGKVHLHRVEAVMRAIGRMEDNIFKKRREDECRRRIRDEKRKQQNRNHRRFGDAARNAPAQSGIQVFNCIFVKILRLLGPTSAQSGATIATSGSFGA